MVVNDVRIYVRPMLAIGSLCALIWFYTLMAFGNEIPVEVNSFWIPILWWFGERTASHIKEDK